MKTMIYSQYIDHTLLKPDATKEMVLQLCDEAKTNHFASVCVNPCHVYDCATYLKNSGVKVCTVIGFPLGTNTTEVKVFETKNAIENGADEIDMVVNIGALKEGNYDYVYKEMKAIKEASQDHIVKVIIETCLLKDEEKKIACQLALKAQADFVKTSTGMSTYGATSHDVALMKEIVGNQAQVKASGGIRTLEDMLTMIESGATRIGTSSGIKMLNNDKTE